MPRRVWPILGMVGVSVGACVALSGAALLANQTADWLETRSWQGYSLLDLAISAEVKQFLPLWLSSWLLGPTHSSLQGLVVWILDTTPAWLGFITLGALIIWKTIRW